MADREKIIKGLESLRDICNARSNISDGDTRIMWAGYGKTVSDAIVLLKEDEPVKAKYHRGSYYHGAYYECGKCGYDFGTKKPKVCPNCNRVVK